MIKPRILVTGATGKTGSVVVAELLKTGHPVRAMVRREDGRSAQLKALGAEIAVVEMSDVERIAGALNNVQRAYYCPPFDPYMIQGAAAFAVAARESRLEHIVGLTQWLSSPSHPALMTRQHWLVDRLFSMTEGVAHTVVRPGFFADAYLVLTGVAANLGVFPWIFGDSRNAPPSNEDIARVAVSALMDPARHAGKIYRPTGPELLGGQDMANAIGRAVSASGYRSAARYAKPRSNRPNQVSASFCPSWNRFTASGRLPDPSAISPTISLPSALESRSKWFSSFPANLNA
jgi:uncharacterized protein YbjT (DUF2867 family)